MPFTLCQKLSELVTGLFSETVATFAASNKGGPDEKTLPMAVQTGKFFPFGPVRELRQPHDSH